MQLGALSVVAVVVQSSVHELVHELVHSVDAVAVHDVSQSLYSSVTHESSTATVMH